MTGQEEVLRLRQLLAVAQKALATCETHYTEYTQFEGSWNSSFSEADVYSAIVQLNAELGLPPPAPFNGN